MRVVALTADPSLEAALNMMGDWDVVAVPDVETAAERTAGAQVMLIGLGILSDGVERAMAARHAGVTLPVVVVGEGEAPEGSTITVVQRPFTLDDLREAVERARTAPISPSDPAQPEPPVSQQPQPTADAEPIGAGDQPRSSDAESIPESGPTERRVEHVEDLIDDPELADLDLAEVRMSGSEAAGTAAPLTLVPQPVPQPAESAPQPPAVPPAPVPAPVPTPVAAPPAPPAALDQDRPQPSRRERKRQKRERGAPHAAPVSPMGAKLASGARAARELAELLHTLPMLRDAKSLAEALIGEVTESFSPKIAVAYLRRGEKFHVIADHGLSNAERTLSLPEGHAIFQEVGDDPLSILIAPVDLAKGIVSGIAGSRTEALLVGPITIEGRVVGLIIVGRDDFDDKDLDVLDELVQEAAPGVAVAQLIGELGAHD